MIYRFFKEPLNLICMQIHRYDSCSTSGLQHLGNQFAAIGTLGLSFLSCLAQPKYGITAVICLADALLAASNISNNSIKFSELGWVEPIKNTRPHEPTLQTKVETLHRYIVRYEHCPNPHHMISLFSELIRYCSYRQKFRFGYLIGHR